MAQKERGGHTFHPPQASCSGPTGTAPSPLPGEGLEASPGLDPPKGLGSDGLAHRRPLGEPV